VCVCVCVCVGGGGGGGESATAAIYSRMELATPMLLLLNNLLPSTHCSHQTSHNLVQLEYSVQRGGFLGFWEVGPNGRCRLQAEIIHHNEYRTHMLAPTTPFESHLHAPLIQWNLHVTHAINYQYCSTRAMIPLHSHTTKVSQN
jgi:hypothetical protein